MIYKPKKLTKGLLRTVLQKFYNDNGKQGKSVYVQQEHHETFNRLTNIMGIDKLTIYAYLDNIIGIPLSEFRNWLGKSITRNTNHCLITPYVVVGGTFLPLKIIFKEKNKKKSHFNKGGQAEKPKETE